MKTRSASRAAPRRKTPGRAGPLGRPRGPGARALVAPLAIVLAGGPAAAEGEDGSPAPVPRPSADERTAAAFDALDSSAARYCRNIADAAAEARIGRQAAALRRLESEIEARLERLEEKRRETEVWLRKREAFLALAEEGLVAIYARMRPDAAAAQLAIMNDVTAAAILSRLESRAASAVLAEMAPDVAARLASIMVGIGSAETSRETAG